MKKLSYDGTLERYHRAKIRRMQKERPERNWKYGDFVLFIYLEEAHEKMTMRKYSNPFRSPPQEPISVILHHPFTKSDYFLEKSKV
jgi:hypothetical protein